MISFSIITISYNASEVIQPTLDSVFSQDYPHVEHLIVDGASNDDTVAMAQSYKSKNDASGGGHVVVISSEPDKGLYDAMNKGLQLATGDYVLFLNAGDCLAAADTLSRVAGAATVGDGEQLPVVIYGDTDVYDADGRYVGPRHLSVPEHLTWRSFRRGMLVCHQAFYALREVAAVEPYNLDYRLSADVDWCIRVMKAAAKERIPLLNLKMVVANYTEEGQTTQHHRESLWERYHVMERHYGRVQTFLLHLWFAVRSLFK